MTYLDEFKEAHQRSKRFGLRCPEIPVTCDRLLTSSNLEKIPYVVGELNIREVVAQCLSLHLQLREPLERFFGVPIIYTIGYVYNPPHFLFKKTESELLALLNEGIRGTQVSLHAWLTLPSMELLDFSLCTSLAVMNKWSEGHGGIVSRHADELVNGLRYHPMLLGEDYLRRIGCLIDLEVFSI